MGVRAPRRTNVGPPLFVAPCVATYKLICAIYDCANIMIVIKDFMNVNFDYYDCD